MSESKKPSAHTLAAASRTVCGTLTNLTQLILRDATREDDSTAPVIENGVLVSVLQGVTTQVEALGDKLEELASYVDAEFSTLQEEIDSSTLDLEAQQKLKERVHTLEKCVEELKGADSQEVQALKAKIEAMESAERETGVHAKLVRQEKDIDEQRAKITFLETFLALIKSEVKRSKERRRNLGVLEKVAAERTAEKFDRHHEECMSCERQDALPPQCVGHVEGPTNCILYEEAPPPSEPQVEEPPQEAGE
jgi:DNA repair exonuclease SbcCD ATPase subunit